MANSKWDKIPLQNLCTKIGDGIHGTPEYVENSNIFFINGNNLKAGNIVITKDTKQVPEAELESNYIELNENSLLLSINGTLGSMAFYNNESVMLGKSVAYLNFKSDINRFYYYYFQLKGVQEYFYNVATGSTIKNLSLKSIQDFEVPYPEEKEWKPIAKVLSDLDAKIELNNKINQELEAMAKTLYDYWFVQFDFPDEHGKPYKSSGGKMVYNEELKRKIPEGWEVGTLDKVCVRIQSGGTPTSTNMIYYTGDFNWFTTKELKDDILLESENKITKKAINESSAKVFPRGTVTIAIYASPTVGRVGILSEESSFNQACCGLIPNINIISKEYLFLTLILYRKKLNALASGTTQKNLGVGTIKSQNIVIPNNLIMMRFNSIIEPVFSKKEIILKENQQLTALRDWLLPMLMNGQVSVKETKTA